MQALLLYWLKANAVLALFAAAYYGLLRQLTFFQLNRAYLLLAVLFAAVYPLLPMPALLPAVAVALPAAATAAAVPAAAGLPAAPGVDWWPLAGAVYLAGAAGLLLRLLGQLLSLGLLRRRSQPAVVLGQAVRVVSGAGSPFSFGATIYLTASSLADADALPATLRHEQAHVQQGHTLDVLLLQVATALAWLNPAAWLLRRFALDNLEYLADQAALRHSALATRDYQHLLLRQQTAGVPAPALAFHFSFLTLKNRIRMLNQPHSTQRQLGRYLLAASLVVGLALGYSGAHAQSAAPQPAPATKPIPKNIAYYVDGKQVSLANMAKLQPHDIKSIDVVKSPADREKLGLSREMEGAVLITTQANANTPDVVAFNQRFPVQLATPAQNQAIAAIQLYLKQHYPAAKVEAVGPVPNKENRYQATYEENSKRWQLFFDGEGNVVPQ